MAAFFADPVLITAGLMLLVLTVYAVLGGADFGGGIGDLLAFGPRAEAHRAAVARAMGPVWEANHVWLIFVLVLLFTAFPHAFGALGVAFFLPFHLALVGIVLRGAAFVFRGVGVLAGPPRRAWTRAFGAASLVTPFILGASLGAISGGDVRVLDGQVTVNHWQAWFSPSSLTIGALTLALCAYLAAVYLILETEGDVQQDFRRRALGSGLATALLAVLLLPLVAGEAPRLWARLWSPRTLPLIILGAALAALSLWAVWSHRYRLGRMAAVAEVAVLLWGWGLAQWPYLIYPDVTVYAAAAPAPVLWMTLRIVAGGLVVLVPSLWLLFAVFKGRNPATERR